MATTIKGHMSAWPAAVCLAFLLSHPVAAQQVPFFVVVHPDNEIDMLSREMISSMFLKNTTTWRDGVPAEPIDLDPTSVIREAFSKEVHDRDTAAIKTYWKERIWNRDGAPPPEASSEDEAIAFVRQRRGGIAYVSTSASFDGVKLIALVNPPVVIKRESPSYPQHALRLGVEGDVVLRLQISEEGTVEDVAVLQGLKYGLTEAAVRAVKRWRFEPATSGGITVSAEIDVTVNFRL